ncbi:MAG: hypothetical protein RIC95_04990 [Vicingaceae bacterium]
MLRKQHFFVLFLLVTFSLLQACKKEEGEEKSNQAPETTFSLAEFNLSGDDRLNSIVNVEWYGSDPDGYVIGFELSLDNQNWTFTTKQDSTFQFSIASGSDTADIELYVRAIDNDNVRDQSPDYLKIPIKNTAPTIEFNEDLSPPDTAYLVATTEWSANDIDGSETITNVQLSADGTNWIDISRFDEVFSLVPHTNSGGANNVSIYYSTDLSPNPISLPGLKVNDTNKLFIRARDQAGAFSEVDTSTTFYLKEKQNNTLLIGGVPAANSQYKSLLQAANVSFDFIDYGINDGVNQPKIWSITFSLLLEQYDKLLLYSDNTGFTNSYSNVKALILEFAASSLQSFTNNGGKYIIASSFDHNTDIAAFRGILPIESVSSTNYGLARLYKEDGFRVLEDSLVTSPLVVDSTPDPNDPNKKIPVYLDTLTISPINPNATFIVGVGVFNVNPIDSEVLYEAALSNGRWTNEWMDTKVIASGRRSGGKLNQVYFSVQLIELNGENNMPGLVDFIINSEFN